MSRARVADVAERKAQLETRAALERIRMTLAVHALRTSIVPARPARESPLGRPVLAILVGIAARRVGPARLRRIVRFASFAVAAYRLVANLRR